ncbi:ATP-grasp domain-containing protein [Tenacibaculum finnmarkense]|uniref:ATP-grasp domain-containing protein n=1 Tax=Tenacibaculum finnmarkense TaxID=2781243 RepID=UPI001E28E2EF|nr:ATP-grasp domain-containing protein [Tenacibaculum finnmarkense]MCD8435939.1 ATP-grasp domain-containing protein [Tenacibaculum dicentrarchi]MCD8401297.1 ATP-grasp domain-containing protein [Tenacibaculum finnmarkense genomovar ulcerans]MCG8750533.1 ATP-grasp domain-containing protein [Tenacibaculum finnmarkense]MCG8755502.1 ATP-grasp domain-containing protein [Tenacibaculum finnmarkense]MCG8784074.1 ATP-grasp domain-containing protein [Tenacibaculum finnmarkense]
MYYIIQKNVFQDPRYDVIFVAMEELGLDYERIEFKPNSNEFEIKTNRKDIFVYGSVKLAKVTADFDWFPGSFYGNNHEFEHYSKGYGINTINYGSYITHFSDKINWSDKTELFIKPSIDAKVFTGKVFNESEWNDFVYNSLNDSQNQRVNKNTAIQIAEPYSLIKEARIWIVDKKVVTSSYYRFHGGIEYEENVEDSGLEFAQSMAKLYTVADAYVMDIALTYDGWKIMEINCINSAGFYKGNVKKIIEALENYYGNNVENTMHNNV